MAEESSFQFLGRIARFLANPKLSKIATRLKQFLLEIQEATECFVAEYSPPIATIEQSLPSAGSIVKRFTF